MAVGGALGDLVLSLSADTAKFESDLGKAHRQSVKFGNDVEKSMQIAGAAILALGSATALLVKNGIDTADAMGKMAQKVGVSVEALSAYAVSARLADVSNEQLQVGLKQLSKNQADFVRGQGEARDAFAALGITQQQVNALNGDTAKLFELVAGKLATFEDGANKTALAMKIFGKSGADLIPLINSLEETRGEAEKLGAVIDTKTAKAAEKFNDDLSRAAIAVGAMGSTLARDLLPVLTTVSEELANSARSLNELSTYGKLAKTALETLVIVGANTKFVFEALGLELYRVAASAAAIAKLDFSGARFIWDEIGKGIAKSRAELDAFEQRIMGVKSAAGAADSGAPRLAAPALFDTAQVQKDAAFVGQQLAEAAEDEIRIMSEVAHWTAFYRNQQLEAERAVNEQRIAAMIEMYDREQEIAIERGAAMIEADGIGHAMKLEAFRQALLTQEEIEIEAHEKRLERLSEFSDDELAAMGGRHALMQQMESEHQNRLLQIEARKHDMVRTMEVGTYQIAVGLLQKFAGQSKAAAVAIIAIEKGLAIAQIQINTGVAVMRALAELGPVAGAAAAAKIKALGAIQTGLVLATGLVEVGQLGSGGGGASVALPPAGGVTVEPSGPLGGQQLAAPAPQAVTIHLHGEGYSQKQVRKLIEAIAESRRDAGALVVSR